MDSGFVYISMIFEPGVAIIDNVADAIKKSRKVLAVLSPNFLSSDWCIDEPVAHVTEL